MTGMRSGLAHPPTSQRSTTPRHPRRHQRESDRTARASRVDPSIASRDERQLVTQM